MEFATDTTVYRAARDVQHCYDWAYSESPKSYHYAGSPRSGYHYAAAGPWSPWDMSQYSDYSVGSPRTPLPRTPLLGGKFIEIQPRSDNSDLRDKRMLMPVTRKRKGNNRYGQSGSYRCLRCQKGKRKCVYDSKKNDCQRCLERGFTDCGEKLPTPRKLAALRLLQESADRYLSKQQSPQQNAPTRATSPGTESSSPSSEDSDLRSPTFDDEDRSVIRLPRPELFDSGKPQFLRSSSDPASEALYLLWQHLTI